MRGFATRLRGNSVKQSEDLSCYAAILYNIITSRRRAIAKYMPAKNHLSQAQKEDLIKLLRESDNHYTREKVLIILLINDGKTYQEISEFLDIAYTTVAYWSVHGDPDKPDSFSDERSQGNFRKVTPEYEKILLETIEKNPEEYGYEFGRWTAARLATYLASYDLKFSNETR